MRSAAAIAGCRHDLQVSGASCHEKLLAGDYWPCLKAWLEHGIACTGCRRMPLPVIGGVAAEEAAVLGEDNQAQGYLETSTLFGGIDRRGSHSSRMWHTFGLTTGDGDPQLTMLCNAVEVHDDGKTSASRVHWTILDHPAIPVPDMLCLVTHVHQPHAPCCSAGPPACMLLDPCPLQSQPPPASDSESLQNLCSRKQACMCRGRPRGRRPATPGCTSSCRSAWLLGAWQCLRPCLPTRTGTAPGPCSFFIHDLQLCNQLG